jgi:hypothetical protein
VIYVGHSKRLANAWKGSRACNAFLFGSPKHQ